MKNLTRVLIATSAALVLLGIAMPYYGKRYGEYRTSVRAVDGFGREFDWVTSEWDHRGYYLVMVGVFIGFLLLVINLARRLYPR
jgi:hypothetical protein